MLLSYGVELQHFEAKAHADAPRILACNQAPSKIAGTVDRYDTPSGIRQALRFGQRFVVETIPD